MICSFDNMQFLIIRTIVLKMPIQVDFGVFWSKMGETGTFWSFFPDWHGKNVYQRRVGRGT